MTDRKSKTIACNQDSSEFISLEQASKKFDLNVFEFIRLGVFEGLFIYIYASNNSPFYPHGTIQGSDNRLYLDGYFTVSISDLKKILSSHDANIDLRCLISESGEKFVKEAWDSVSVKDFSMFYIRKTKIEELINAQRSESTGLGRREIQIEIILSVIDALGFEEMKIPNGGKAKIKEICIKRHKVFTDSSFDHSWKSGVKQGFFRLENHENYLSKS